MEMKKQSGNWTGDALSQRDIMWVEKTIVGSGTFQRNVLWVGNPGVRPGNHVVEMLIFVGRDPGLT